MPDSSTSATIAAKGTSVTQWAWRASKSIGLNTGTPSFSAVSGFEQVTGPTRVFQYSPDGSTFAAAMEEFTRLVDTREASSSKVKLDLPASKVVALEFSPKGNYLSTWERPNKLEDGSMSRNLRIWNSNSGEEIASFERKTQEGCFFQFTSTEDYCVRQVTGELQVYSPKTISDGVVGRLKVDGMTSFQLGPGEKPSIAVFCGERKGAPASVRIYSLASLLSSTDMPALPLSQKTFFKADKIHFKWNRSGSALLFLTSTDVDKTNASYYGESNLYMMTANGSFDCRVSLDKEGPIHDYEWSPNSREFVVIYGFMPAKVVLFSYKVNVIAELGTQPRNFVAYNPQGRLICIAGFGNLSGMVDVWDRENLAGGKIYSFDGSNSSVCQWSPDGHFLLTATLSPRLRVDNGVRIWHCTGNLVHIEMINELYQAGWRPALNMAAASFPQIIPPAPAPSPAAAAYIAEKAAKPKVTGTYRPPGARGTATPDIFKRHDLEAGGSGASSPGSLSRNNSIPGAPSGKGRGEGGSYTAPGAGNKGRRAVPGAPVPGAPPKSSGAAIADKKVKQPKKGAGANGSLASTTTTAAAPTAAEEPYPAVSGAAEVSGSFNSAQEKKARNLTKKLKAIQELKERQAKGEKLEQTQVQKIQAEAEIRAELAAL
ncbi:translation initiation factor eIF-2A [Tilletiaria anomala UBC 951]|uniref:Eukaryotic translation initiation factor 2A n=1 Tax=Tilletiaria anomala (strain ATCC 24038 / CBS 436.72 / UBC 951) TaxID=1037660 RepID=A0A066W379_TILAU|nr:translation initiation factor eIF-2A [Tilletiaria anomala UBC 951]KDN48186.1 translation initiation factor eIF-2A [Tilletiaria anomala UBC 951]